MIQVPVAENHSNMPNARVFFQVGAQQSAVLRADQGIKNNGTVFMVKGIGANAQVQVKLRPIFLCRARACAVCGAFVPPRVKSQQIFRNGENFHLFL